MKLQKIKLREMSKSTKNKIWNGSILAAFIAAAAVFIIMLQAEKKVLAEYEKITVCVTIDDLPKGESITEDNILNYVQTVEIDRKIVPDTAIKNMDEITGRIAVHRIEKGSVVTRGMLESEEQITGEMEEAVIAGFRAEDLYQAVGGVLRAGDRIHIYCIDKEETAKEKPVWKNLFVQQVFDQNGNAIDSGDTTTPAQRINVYMDNGKVDNFFTEIWQKDRSESLRSAIDSAPGYTRKEKRHDGENTLCIVQHHGNCTGNCAVASGRACTGLRKKDDLQQQLCIIQPGRESMDNLCWGPEL